MVRTVSFSPDGRYLVSVDGGIKATGRLWNVTDHSCLVSLPDHQLDDPIISISFSPNGKLLASVSGNSSVQLWSVEKKTCLLILPNHHAGGIPESIAFTPDGQTLAIGGSGVVRLWNPNEERRQRDEKFDWKEIVRLWKS